MKDKDIEDLSSKGFLSLIESHDYSTINNHHEFLNILAFDYDASKDFNQIGNVYTPPPDSATSPSKSQADRPTKSIAAKDEEDNTIEIVDTKEAISNNLVK